MILCLLHSILNEIDLLCFFFNNFIISPHLCISTSLLQEQKQAKAYNIAPEFKRIVEWRYQLLVIKAFLRKKEIKIETQYNINKYENQKNSKMKKCQYIID